MEQTDQMGARLHIEGQQDGRDVVFHRAERQLSRRADFLIAAAFEDQLEDLQMPAAELGDAIVV